MSAINIKPTAPRSTRLAVCANDCMLDFGQPESELMPICFQVHCAFAKMRWGTLPEAFIQAHADATPNSAGSPR
jgi:hypothetical protein